MLKRENLKADIRLNANGQRNEDKEIIFNRVVLDFHFHFLPSDFIFLLFAFYFQNFRIAVFQFVKTVGKAKSCCLRSVVYASFLFSAFQVLMP